MLTSYTNNRHPSRDSECFARENSVHLAVGGAMLE